MTSDLSIACDTEPGSTMDDAWVCKRVVALFEKHRATPGAPYDEARFKDFMLAETQGRRAVLEGFSALRRLNAFVDDVQYEFAICCSIQDRRANDSLSVFVERVIELGSSRSRLPRSLIQQLAAGTEWALALLANLVLLVAAVSLRNHEWALGALGCAALFVNTWFAGVAWRTWTYCERLRARIEAVEQQRKRPGRARMRPAVPLAQAPSRSLPQPPSTKATARELGGSPRPAAGTRRLAQTAEPP
jgi:hypothetical protein